MTAKVIRLSGIGPNRCVRVSRPLFFRVCLGGSSPGSFALIRSATGQSSITPSMTKIQHEKWRVCARERASWWELHAPCSLSSTVLEAWNGSFVFDQGIVSWTTFHNPPWIIILVHSAGIKRISRSIVLDVTCSNPTGGISGYWMSHIQRPSDRHAASLIASCFACLGFSAQLILQMRIMANAEVP